MSDDENRDRSHEAERVRRQRGRSVAIAWALIGLAALFFIVTIVRLGGNVANRPF